MVSADSSVDRPLAFLRANRSEAYGRLRVIELLEAHGREREAFAEAEVAYRDFRDDWRVQEVLLRFYERDGWTAEVLTLRRSASTAPHECWRYPIPFTAP